MELTVSHRMTKDLSLYLPANGTADPEYTVYSPQARLHQVCIVNALGQPDERSLRMSRILEPINPQPVRDSG